MSLINTVGSSLNADTLPGAFLEAALFLDAGEKLRNGANPGITPKNFVTASFSADEGVVTIAASLPVDVAVSASGSVSYTAKDYLGGTYAAFIAGGAVTANTRMAALVQVAQLLSAAEKAVQPAEDQPNFLQLESSSETGTISINAALPVSSSIDASGNVLFSAIDYL